VRGVVCSTSPLRVSGPASDKLCPLRGGLGRSCAPDPCAGQWVGLTSAALGSFVDTCTLCHGFWLYALGGCRFLAGCYLGVCAMVLKSGKRPLFGWGRWAKLALCGCTNPRVPRNPRAGVLLTLCVAGFLGGALLRPARVYRPSCSAKRDVRGCGALPNSGSVLPQSIKGPDEGQRVGTLLENGSTCPVYPLAQPGHALVETRLGYAGLHSARSLCAGHGLGCSVVAWGWGLCAVVST
jgi:hypothetical protein